MSRLPLRWTIPAIAVVLVLVAETVLGVAVLALTQRQLRDQADHKLEQVTKYSVQPGSLVNIEIDTLARYVARLKETA